MAWNPDVYNKFKSERSAPFYDLCSLLEINPGMAVIDLGCGTGELTQKLAEMLPGSTVLGIDASPEMLQKSKAFESEQIQFKCNSIEDQIALLQKWDLVFSNAAIQWVDSHTMLLPQIISTINKGGQLAIQMPAQHHNISNIILNELAATEPFATELQNWKGDSPVLEIDDYAQILYEQGGTNIQVFEKIYPLILANANALFDWVSGTALIPYMEKLNGELQQQFVAEFKNRLQQKFPASPVFYPFKRILMAATF